MYCALFILLSVADKNFLKSTFQYCLDNKYKAYRHEITSIVVAS